LNFARLNHILIPATKEGRDAQRDRIWVRWALIPVASLYLSLSELGRGLLGLSVLAGFMGLDVLRGQNYFLSAGLWTLLLGSLAVRRFFAVEGLQVDVQAPARALVGEPIPFRIGLRNTGRTKLQALRLRRPFLPWDGSWNNGDRALAELEPGERIELMCQARFVARGRHHIDTFGVAAAVPLGLALGPELESRGTRFTVWPRPVHLEGIGFELGRSEHARQAPRARVGGDSLELIGLRPYRQGDPVRDLHAPTWARLGEPVVRAYQAHEIARVAVVLDADLRDEDRLEGAVSVVAGLVIDAAGSGAEIELVVLDDDHPDVLSLGRGRGAVDQALDSLACVRGRHGAASEPSLARHGRGLEAASEVFFVTPGLGVAALHSARTLTRMLPQLRVFALAPRPRRFGRGRVDDAETPPDAGGLDLRRVSHLEWSRRRRVRRRNRS